MNVKIDTEIRSAIAHIVSQGLVLHQGAWFTFDGGGRVTGCDPIGAVLHKNNLVPEGIGLDYNRLRNPGFIKSACIHLNVDPGWLYRFFMGFDRNHHVTVVSKKEDKETESKDEVSAYGIQLYREYIKTNR